MYPRKISVCLPILTMSLMAIIIVSNTLGIKPFTLYGLTLTGGSFIFPLTFTIVSIISEVYGFRVSAKILLASATINILSTLYRALIISLTPAAFWPDQAAFAKLLGASNLLFTVSTVAYLSAQLLGAYLISRQPTGEQSFLKRFITANRLASA